MSLTRMITTTDVFGRRVREDATIRYAVYQRTAGGKVVFKGRQDTLETWARSTTTFRRSPMRNALHWTWTITGALSAIASVICMVNMAGYLQLAYLGTLLLSSLGEIFATQLIRHIQRSFVHYDANALTHEDILSRLSDGVANEKWYLAQRLAGEIADARTVARKS
ncbi:hypothetical protein LTR48_006686 [Friedmanniomyces endolithicus]|uniref:SMODS and SLOG-associating 2TM effector domain-containing protein n=1 Tax=Rachicladosporium monterosium TaxID=1507873 RepID=A0ABR0KZC9_9PEZI|nr:hypothetical protein LTR48_006686 [Friedmanniomyces endolithicus]KAK5140563.1 hypothetical protein LTR32_006674 [Rachicladosporium monterosium]